MDDIIGSEMARNVLTSIPFEEFKELCKRDDLNIEREGVLLDLVKAYIAKRDSLEVEDKSNLEQSKSALEEAKEDKDKIPIREEGQILLEAEASKEKPAVNENENEIEEKKEQEDAEKGETPIKEGENQIGKEANENDDLNTEQNDIIENKELSAEKVQDISHEKAEAYEKIAERMKYCSACHSRIKRLANEEKLELLRCIRYSHLEHKELLTIVNDPTFTLAKDFILQGLSLRLNRYETLPDNKNWDIKYIL
eukprot:TRINITY_DN1110_c0_g8_i1.p1 TRINITY_DN1110_c0_g8~~TRINITY_DN1110_c0_g8_i1.p1  ORF type:complete len:253 (+),score=62.75 TRINITY_DN1110_c0_g8_i1:155-913(+)